MDFIPFNNGSNTNKLNKSPRNLKQNRNLSNGLMLNTSIPGTPSFGSPAVSFGSPALSYGGPACSSPGFSPAAHRHHGPRMYPQHSSPRFQPSHSHYHSTPPAHRPHYPSFQNSQGGNDSTGIFRTPKSPSSFSQSGNQSGRGSGRKSSFHRHFSQTPWSDQNSSRSSSIDEFYQPSMVTDPWMNLRPVTVNQIKEGSL